MARETRIEQAEGYPTIYVWEQSSTGEKWACCAYDHGPMCRLCQRVDETLDALLESCAEGDLLARADPAGQFVFETTAKGIAKAEDLIASSPEAADLWAQIQAKHGKPEISQVAEKVLVAMNDGTTGVPALVAATGLTAGQVLQAMNQLAAVGYIEGAE